MSIENNIKNPSMKYRPVPFWSWNDKLENDELRLQIKHMYDVGLGGYFMHARGGLLTEYMGEEWFDAVDACLDKGAELEMHSWAYDENGWPSGFGDGKVNGLGEKYQQKYLRAEVIPACELKRSGRTIAVYTANGKERIGENGNAKGDVLHLYYDVNEFYVDTLDREVTVKFIELIYQKYYERLDREGRSPSELTGFFTDEPQISRNGMPWSQIMEEEYRAAYGEELLDVLPHMFYREGDFRRTRYRVWKLITQLFMNNFMKPIHDWCGERGWQVTGHHVCEESYWSQLTSNGAVMPQYQYYHIPGMDWLGRHIKPVTTPVQVASVCAQLGKKQILSETFALCGWNVKPEELKWMYQWQMVHGINLLCPHLESYSLKGIRKRDYPASHFRHQPWWADYRDFFDYASRVGVLIAEGGINVDVLIMHGQSSAWLEYNANEKNNQSIEKYFKSLNEISELLDNAHINYHYGDETMAEMHGKVSGGEFVIGAQSYKVLVMPRMENLSAKVFAMLNEFTAQGGKVLAVRDTIGDGVCYVDGVLNPEMEQLQSRFVWFDDEATLAAALNRYAACMPVVKTGTQVEHVNELDSQLEQINCTRRFFDELNGSEAVVYYYVNNDLKNGYDADVYLPYAPVERFDAVTGEFTSVEFERQGNMFKVSHYFSPAGDLILVGRKHTTAIPSGFGSELSRTAPAKLNSGFKPVDLNGLYDIKLATENIITLDHCSFSFDGELQEENEYVLVIQDRLLKKRRPVELEMNFELNIDADFDFKEELYLVMECPELYKIKVNGVEIDASASGFMYDPAFQRVSITGMVRPGQNIITLEVLFTQSEKVYKSVDAAAIFESEKNKLSYDMEIESIYIAGNFGVKTTGGFVPLEREAVRYAGGFILSAAPEQVELDKLHECRLPFFGGTVLLKREFKLGANELNGRFLVFDAQKAMVSKIKINGREAGKFLWRPFAASLDGILQRGANTIEIELCNGLRNVLGPHHLEEGESYGVCPSSFYKEPGVFARTWSGSYIDWNDAYCFVEFGVDNLRIV
jgi:hypothetical protein